MAPPKSRAPLWAPQSNNNGTLKDWRVEALPQLSSFQVNLLGSGVSLGRRGVPNKEDIAILAISEEGWCLRVRKLS